VEVNRDKLARLDVDFGQAMQTFHFYFGVPTIKRHPSRRAMNPSVLRAKSDCGLSGPRPQQLKSLFVSNRSGETCAAVNEVFHGGTQATARRCIP